MESRVRHNVSLIVTSLLSMLFVTFHLADDIVRGFSPGGFSNLTVTVALVVWLYGTLMLAGKRSGYVINLVLSLLASGLPMIHMTGKGMVGGRVAGTSGAFFFVWTLLALSVSAACSLVLSARGLWSLRRGQPR
jgi:hypothetical protein